MEQNRLEVLVATMHQTDFSKIEEMNLRSNVVFANQADRQDYQETEFGGHLARMVTTDQRGVGRNRNLALLYARAEFLLFADDDMFYYDDYAEQVIRAFKELPEADVIVFARDFSKNGEIFDRSRHGKGPLPQWKSWRYGTCALAARRESLLRGNVWFSLLFGGGCPYSSGEDSLFINDCYKSGLKVYTHPYVLCCCKKDGSTWFEGYTEKYFIDKGCWLSQAMPWLCRLAVPALAFKWRSLNPDFGAAKIARLMNRGITEFRRR